MNRKLALITALLLTVVLLAGLTMSGCRKNDTADTELVMEYPAVEEVETASEEGMRETMLCFQDDNGYIIPVMMKIPWEEGIAKAALKKMKNSSDTNEELLSMGLNALLPGDVEILGMSINEGLAKVDFSDDINSSVDALSESNMISGIVMTLTAFPAIDEVQVMVDGAVVNNLSYGTNIAEPMSAIDFNLERASDAIIDGAKVTVFFHNTSSSLYDYIVPVTRITDSPLNTLETAMNELVKGPKDTAGLDNGLPEGTEVLGVQMIDGVTYINFSSEFNALSDNPIMETLALKSIMLTAGNYPEVSEVVVMVDGEDYGMNMEMPVFANEY